jgi:hypothetical protein
MPTTPTRVTTYSADEVTLSLFGRQIDSGYADGEFVSVEKDADDFTDKAGSDGEVARAKTNDKRATWKVKLLQTSLGNNILSAQRTLDLGSQNGAGVGVAELRDPLERRAARALGQDVDLEAAGDQPRPRHRRVRVDAPLRGHPARSVGQPEHLREMTRA